MWSTFHFETQVIRTLIMGGYDHVRSIFNDVHDHVISNNNLAIRAKYKFKQTSAQSPAKAALTVLSSYYLRN